MKIIESSIIGKKSPEACEDGMVVTDDFIAVIDGSTSKTPKHLNPDMKNGRYAMMLISEYIREELKADASVDDFCQGVTAYIYNKVYEKLGVEERLKEHPEERLTASAILYSRTRNEVWMVGDCQAIIDGKLYENGKPYEEKIARKRVELIEQGLSPAEARKQIEPLLIEAMLSDEKAPERVLPHRPRAAAAQSGHPPRGADRLHDRLLRHQYRVRRCEPRFPRGRAARSDPRLRASGGAGAAHDLAASGTGRGFGGAARRMALAEGMKR